MLFDVIYWYALFLQKDSARGWRERSGWFLAAASWVKKVIFRKTSANFRQRRLWVLKILIFPL